MISVSATQVYTSILGRIPKCPLVTTRPDPGQPGPGAEAVTQAPSESRPGPSQAPGHWQALVPRHRPLLEGWEFAAAICAGGRDSAGPGEKVALRQVTRK